MNTNEIPIEDEQPELCTLVEDNDVLAGLALCDKLIELAQELPTLLKFPSQREATCTSVYQKVLLTLVESGIPEQLATPVREFLASFNAAFAHVCQVDTWEYNGKWSAQRVQGKHGEPWPETRDSIVGSAKSEEEALERLYQVYPELRLTHSSASIRRCPLTLRQVEVLELVAAGKGNKEIGIILGLSPNTIKNHLTRIEIAMQAPNRIAIVVRALKAGWITGPVSRSSEHTREE